VFSIFNFFQFVGYKLVLCLTIAWKLLTDAGCSAELVLTFWR